MGSDWFTPGVWPTFMPDRSFILVWIQETVLVCALIKWVTLGVSLIVKMTTPCLRGNQDEESRWRSCAFKDIQ